MRSIVRKIPAACCIAFACALLVSSVNDTLTSAGYRHDRGVAVEVRLLAPTPPAISRADVAPKRHPASPAPRPLTKKQRAAFRRLLLELRRRAALAAYFGWLWEYTHTPVDWFAMAACETGGDWNVTGARYSTGLGMLNQAIRENSPPDVAGRELAGTASVFEIIGTGKGIAARFGIHAWGCGKKLYP